MRKDRLKQFLSNTIRIYKSLFEKSFWVKLFALNPSFFFKTRVLPQSRKAYTIQRHIITIFSKPCQIHGSCSVPRVSNLHLPTRRGFSATPEPTYRGTWLRRGEVPSPNGLGDSTPIPQCRSLWIDKSTAPRDHSLLFKTGSKT